MYVTNLDDKISKGTHWISLFFEMKYSCIFLFFCNSIYSSRRIKQSKTKELLVIYLEKKIKNLLCVDFYCIAFIEYTLAGKTLDYINFFHGIIIKRMTK